MLTGTRLRTGGLLTYDRPAIVGVVNVTADSFYDGGRYISTDRAIDHGLRLHSEGAAVIEVSGVKAGPGEPVLVEEELRRVLPVIRKLTDHRVTVSVDTFSPQVARAAVEAGAEVVNDIDGMRNPEMVGAVAETGAAAVIMHIQGKPRVAQRAPAYRSVVSDIIQALDGRVAACEEAGIRRDKLIVDPGPGFGKTTQHDLAIVRGLGKLRATRCPVMLAISRKRFIGEVLDEPPANRLVGTLALTAYVLAFQAADLIRTHDVAATKQVIDIIEATRAPGETET
jgi:dihydropteroate synthase